MFSFSLGISSVMLALAYGAREAIATRQEALRQLASRAKPIMGVVFILVGLMIFLKFHHVPEAMLLNMMPAWLQDFSVII